MSDKILLTEQLLKLDELDNNNNIVTNASSVAPLKADDLLALMKRLEPQFKYNSSYAVPPPVEVSFSYLTNHVWDALFQPVQLAYQPLIAPIIPSKKQSMHIFSRHHLEIYRSAKQNRWIKMAIKVFETHKDVNIFIVAGYAPRTNEYKWADTFKRMELVEGKGLVEVEYYHGDIYYYKKHRKGSKVRYGRVVKNEKVSKLPSI